MLKTSSFKEILELFFGIINVQGGNFLKINKRACTSIWYTRVGRKLVRASLDSLLKNTREPSDRQP